MKFSDNTLSAVFNYFQLQLNNTYEEKEVKSITKLLLTDLFGYDGKYLALNPDIRFTESQLLQLISASKKLKTGKPVQYILGHSTFFDLELKVNESVLVPRPETEELVNWIIQETGDESLKILDIGTGSGCIALALKSILKNSKIYAIDFSKNALDIAQENAKNLKLDIHFIEDDILNPKKLLEANSMDIIVSNPPYVLESEKKILHQNVLDFEPHVALFVEDQDALLFYKAIIAYSRRNLKTKGYLYFEINEQFGEEISNLLSDNSFTEVQLKKDLNGKERMIRAKKL